MSPKLILAAGALSFAAFLSSAVNAASPTAEPASQAQPAPQFQPHNHMQEKTGIPFKAPDRQAKAKKPLHDHGKFHKQQ